MKALVQKRKQAEALRRQGHSYQDILREVSVAKSTLSNWLKDFPLTDDEKRYLRTRQDANISRGRVKAATALRLNRISRQQALYAEAKHEFDIFIKNPFFQAGIVLYWAEGAKRSSSFAFSNSDEELMNIMLAWIEIFLAVDRKEIIARLYSHKHYAHENCEAFWAESTQIALKNFRKTTYKPSGLLIKKRPNYKGCLRISLKSGLKYLRKMLYWQKMLFEYYQEHTKLV